MLHIKKVEKYYEVGGEKFWALKGIDLSFRQSEFVAILGQSGSGKTTLLNIIGGLDRYSSGDLIIDDVSTKSYKDKDWDAYRNHRIGFVFQSYNLIPHLDVLSNVELALTLSGVSITERREKALEVLTTVGLKDHVRKRPNQLSGGQQQRVAIARALVNDPNIILADEPTGALDTETSVEIMELLTKISKDKLIIMVTHNPGLAKKYAQRIVNLSDGKVISDTNPYTSEDKTIENKSEKTSMSFFTALRLSFKNLLTKKFRTLITALAGSIGIIGVGLVLSLQYGFTNYLSEMERGTFAGLPIEVSKTFMDIGSVMNPENRNSGPVVENGIIGQDPNSNFMGSNNITTAFIDHLDSSDIDQYADVVKLFGFDINGYNMVDGNLMAPPTSTNMLMPQLPGSPLISESQFSESFINDFFDVLGNYNGNATYGAALVVTSQNTIPNVLASYLGLPRDTKLDYDQILGRTFRIFTNDIFFEQDTQTNLFSKRSLNDLAADFNSGSDKIIEVTITNIYQSNSQFVSVSSGIILDPNTTSTLYNMNYNSTIAVAQRASDTLVLDFIPQIGTSAPTVDGFLTQIGGSQTPGTILFYPNSFDAKERIMEVIADFNSVTENEDDHITAVDNTAAALGMMKTIMNSISAVLIAFASISLVVSSVMIGIITYTSVLERTKEIGVLRSIGARKKDISRVFNAEAILVGFTAGVLGVTITFALVPIVNILLSSATEGSSIASLSPFHAVLLVAISVALTFVAGLFPSRIAAKKDPVVALRTE